MCVSLCTLKRADFSQTKSRVLAQTFEAYQMRCVQGIREKGCARREDGKQLSRIMQKACWLQGTPDLPYLHWAVSFCKRTHWALLVVAGPHSPALLQQVGTTAVWSQAHSASHASMSLQSPSTAVDLYALSLQPNGACYTDVYIVSVWFTFVACVQDIATSPRAFAR